MGLCVMTKVQRSVSLAPELCEGRAVSTPLPEAAPGGAPFMC